MKRIAALILCLLFLLPIVSACAGSADPDSQSGSEPAAQPALENAQIDGGVKAWFTALVKGDNAPFSFTLDGVSSRTFLHTWEKTVDEAPIDGREAVTATYTDPETGLKAVLTATFFDAAVDWVVTFENTGEGNSPAISALRGMDVVFTLPSDSGDYVMNTSYGCRDTRYDDYKDFGLRTFELTAGGEPVSQYPSGGRGSSHAWPFFDVLGDGCGVMAAVGWTGQWIADFAAEEDGVRMSAGLYEFDSYLEPGEQIRTPSYCVIYFEGEAETGHNLLRRTLFNYYMPQNIREDGYPLSINCWGGRTTEYLKSRVDAFSAAGAKTDNLWVDAAWFGDLELVDGIAGFSFDDPNEGWSSKVGTWTPNPNLWPDGNAKEVSDYIHEKGYDFTLWCEPERARIGSEMYTEHRDLFFDLEKNDQVLFNLSTEEGYAWMLQFLSDFIEDNGVDIYRQDFNIEPLAYWQDNDEPGRTGMTEMRYITNLYRLFDALLEKFPDLKIDNCASGGRRIDIEMLKRSFYLWRTDYQVHPYPETNIECIQYHTQGYLYWLPTTATGFGGGYDDWFDKYIFRSLMAQGISIVDDLGADPQHAVERINEAADLRVYYGGDSDYYSLLQPVNDQTSWQAYELMRDGGRDGLLVVYTRQFTKQPTQALTLKGLDEAARYTVTDTDDGSVVAEGDGATLMAEGFTLELAAREAKFYIITAQ